MNNFIVLFIAIVVLLVVGGVASSEKVNVVIDQDKQSTNALIQWIKDSNGYFHDSLEMKRIDPSDTTSYFGMFAMNDIKSNALLLSIPHERILEDPTDADIEFVQCGLIEHLADQLRLGDQSNFAPYVNYLLKTQPQGQLPSAWSTAGKELLMRVLGHEDFNWEKAMANLHRFGDLKLKNILPPEEPITWVLDFHDACGKEGYDLDKLDEHAAMLVIQRGWDNVLIPVYDTLSHRNGDWLNTRSDENGVHNGDVNVYAKRDIKKGEEIYTSYNMCEDCDGRVKTYGTSELFRDYGFVENFPQFWIFNFKDSEIKFRMDEVGHDEEEKSTLRITEWVNGEPSDESFQDIKILLEKVFDGINLLDHKDSHPNVKEYEWNKIDEYLHAMKIALEVALEWRDGQEMCVIEGTCNATIGRYPDLDKKFITEQDSGYMDASCGMEFFDRFNDGRFNELESFESQYQSITFLHDDEIDVTCLELDNIIQICDNYRPHYHEYAVHEATRFLPKNEMKRAVFVGGGDSMLLHELLKYDSLELVVALELDQRVVRGSYKHFGTQPHFDDNRVEWYFGDVTKTLMMIPKEYFASFDLVLVDLSETVMSFKVTDKLDIFQALTLLVKSDGIFVKNEVYFEYFKNIFPYTSMNVWYDVPTICSQVMVMGSRTIDFMTNDLVDQGVESLLVKDLNEILDPHEILHDYSRNMNITDKFCSTNIPDDVLKQNKSPGIILFVEIDGFVDEIILPTNKLRAELDEEFTVIESKQSSFEAFSVSTIVLKEGVVVARFIPENKYVGFDIHLWSEFHKQHIVLDSILSAYDAPKDKISTFRLIAGGMFGIETWKADQKLLGPQFEEICEVLKGSSPVMDSLVEPSISNDVSTIVEYGLQLIDKDMTKIAILLGNEESSNLSFGANVEAFHLRCPSLENFNEYDEHANKNLQECEKALYEMLMGIESSEKFDAIIIHESANKMTVSVFLKLFASHRRDLVKSTLYPHSLLLSYTNNNEERWRKNFMYHFVDDVFVFEPAATAEVRIINRNANSQMNLYIVNHADDHFVKKLRAKVAEINDNGDANTAVVNEIIGGQWKFQPNFEASSPSTPRDYNQRFSFQQWKEQNPVGFQVIFQFEAKANRVPNTSVLLSVVEESMTLLDNEANHEHVSAAYSSEIGGEGVLIIGYFSNGNVSLLYDGNCHIDLNVFHLREDMDTSDLLNLMRVKLKSYKLKLRDEQPRGNGRVVSYKRDIKDTPNPRWAK